MFRVTRATFWPIRSRRPTRRNRSAPPDPEDRRDPFASDRRHLRKRPRAAPARRPARLVGQQTRLGEPPQIGRASGRERVCQYVYIPVVVVSLQIKLLLSTV